VSGAEKTRILIADDEMAIVASLEFLMRNRGFETACATDGESAIALCESFRPHLVLLDLMLPKRSGFEVCRLLRVNRKYDAIKILLVSAKGGAQDLEGGRTPDADGFISKPFSTKELVAEVERLLESH
jgi:DNA-binding response OmpR family regulator